MANPSQSRKHRGYATQRLAADWFNAHGWSGVYPPGAGEKGVDLRNMEGLAPEVKARREFDLTGFLRQAGRNAGDDLPFVVMRPDGYGPERIAQWAMTFTLDHGTRLLLRAGYGDRSIVLPESPE